MNLHEKGDLNCKEFSGVWGIFPIILKPQLFSEVSIATQVNTIPLFDLLVKGKIVNISA